jgi:hypothetical protein
MRRAHAWSAPAAISTTAFAAQAAPTQVFEAAPSRER